MTSLSVLLGILLAIVCLLLVLQYFFLFRTRDVEKRLSHKHQEKIADDLTFRAYDRILTNTADYDLFYRAIMNNVPFPVYCKDVDNDYRYVFHNNSCDVSIGGMFLGHTDFEIFPKDVAQMARQNDLEANALPVGTIHVCEETFKANDSSIRVCKSYKQIVVTSAGRRFLLGVSIDLSEERALRRKEEEISELFKSILDNIPACILAKDVKDGLRHVLWNKELERHTGLTAEQMIGKSDKEIEPWPGLGDLIREFDQQAIREGEVRDDRLCVTASGRQIVYHSVKRSCQLSSGRHLIIDMCIDTTRQRELEELNTEMIEYQRDVIAKDQLMNECMRFAARETDRDMVVNYLLQRVGIEFKADRCFTYQYSDEDCRFADSKHEWTAPGSMPIRHQDNLEMDSFAYLQGCLKSFQAMVVDDVEEMPDGKCKEYMRENNIRSTLVAPVQVGDRLYGFFGLDFVQSPRIFSENDTRLAYNTASLLGLIGTRDYYRALLKNPAQKDSIADSQ